MADPDLWTFAGFPNRAILVGDAPVTVNVTDLTRGSKRRVIWWWYWVDGRYTDNRLWAKLLQAKSMLLWGERRSAVIAVSAEVTTDRQAAEATIADFLSQAETLKSALSDARWVSSESAASAPTGLD